MGTSAPFMRLRVTAMAATLSLVVGGLLNQAASAPNTPDTLANEFALSLVSDPDVVAGPSELFLVSADLFARSYFMDLRPYPSWGPNDARWQKQYPVFLASVLANSLPNNAELEPFLASVLTQRMSAQELLELRAKASKPQFRAAVKRLGSLGLDLRFVLLAQRSPSVIRLYPLSDQKAARRTIELMAGALPELEQAKPDLEALRDFLESNAFKRCQSVVGEAFMQSVGQLEADTKRFGALMSLWRSVLTDPPR